jgi:hypothetical protein
MKQPTMYYKSIKVTPVVKPCKQDELDAILFQAELEHIKAFTLKVDTELMEAINKLPVPKKRRIKWKT